ncbi:MAG: DUF488 family protein [Flavobacterium sp.]|nr:MAG: DUF488 family protein [Flavobacterium sp.]
MTQIHAKRAYDPYSPDDGFRVLVDRLWPRGIKNEDLNCDLWKKEFAPTNSLRKWFHEDKITRWNKFRSLYLAELKEAGGITDFVNELRKHEVVTLIYAAKDELHNHVIILAPFLQKML